MSPHPPRAIGPKVAVPRVVVILGHSIGQGVGGSDAAWAGFGVQPGVTFVDGGSAAAAYPSNAGAGPDTGIVPHLAARLLAAGRANPVIVRRSQSGALLSQLQTNQAASACLDLDALGVGPPDWIIALIGENDSQAGESAAYVTRLPVVLDLLERQWPDARITLHDPITTDLAGYPEVATVAAANASATLLRNTRALASKAGVGLQDTVHPSAAGYGVLAANLWAAYQGLP